VSLLVPYLNRYAQPADSISANHESLLREDSAPVGYGGVDRLETS
jgi:hypothetical protein